MDLMAVVLDVLGGCSLGTGIINPALEGLLAAIAHLVTITMISLENVVATYRCVSRVGQQWNEDPASPEDGRMDIKHEAATSSGNRMSKRLLWSKERRDVPRLTTDDVTKVVDSEFGATLTVTPPRIGYL